MLPLDSHATRARKQATDRIDRVAASAPAPDCIAVALGTDDEARENSLFTGEARRGSYAHAGARARAGRCEAMSSRLVRVRVRMPGYKTESPGCSEQSDVVASPRVVSRVREPARTCHRTGSLGRSEQSDVVVARDKGAALWRRRWG